MIYKKNVKKRFVTLIEMMIVMFLIALITGVVAYNYQGSLDEGKVFKTKAAIAKIETILELEIANDDTKKENISTTWKDLINKSPLVKDRNALIKDGWGVEYEVDMVNDHVRVKSKKLTDLGK